VYQLLGDRHWREMFDLANQWSMLSSNNRVWEPMRAILRPHQARLSSLFEDVSSGTLTIEDYKKVRELQQAAERCAQLLHLAFPSNLDLLQSRLDRLNNAIALIRSFMDFWMAAAVHKFRLEDVPKELNELEKKRSTLKLNQLERLEVCFICLSLSLLSLTPFLLPFFVATPSLST
jgi:hypothetical protein